MTSRFRSNWAKEGPKSTSPTFDTFSSRSHVDDFRSEYYDEDCRGVEATGKRRNGSRVARDSSVENRNGKSRDRNGGGGGSCYGDERELDNESPDRNYYRRYKEDFRCRSAEVEESSRERRPLQSGKKGASGVAALSSTRFDLVEDEADMETLDTALPPALLMTNGNSSARMASNGSSKQVKRSDERRGASGSLTRERTEDLSSPIPHAVDVTNRSTICTNDRSNGNRRERSAKGLSSRNEKNDKVYQTGAAAARINDTNDCGSIDRRRSSRTRDRSHSPPDNFTNGNGNSSLTRGTDTRRRQTRDSDRFYSAGTRGGDADDFGSMDRRSRRHAERRSYTPPEEEEDDKTPNGNSDHPHSSRSERREKRSKEEEFGSIPRRSSRTRVEGERASIFLDHEDGTRCTHETNGSRGENGNGKKYSEIDNDDNSQSRKESSKRKSRTHHKASPEDFDVQIHRYERAIRAPRRDSDLNRKSSFKDHDSDRLRKNSFDDHHHHHHHRSREAQSSKKSSHKHRDCTDTTRRGSSEDRDQEPVSRKSSFKNRDASSTRKSSLTNRNLLDTGPINNNNNNNRNNGSHHRDHSESSRRDRDPSITRRRSSRSNNNDDDDQEEDQDQDQDQDRSYWKNDRHSRPLTPPTSPEDIETLDDPRDPRSMPTVSSSSKDRYGTNEDLEFAHKYAQDHNDYRGKTQHEETGDATQNSDRFSSSTRRVVSSSRSFNESRSSRIDDANKMSTRDPLDDEKDLRRDNGRNSGFSTIERNGTTVIRIRTNSESPVGHLEPRSRRRTSHQEVGASRYRKYEDEAEDEDEDDETFERDHQNQRRDDCSRRNYKVGPRRLWSNRDESVQITDLDDGQPCLHCGETCPGFSPHSWRKNCTSCKCPREAHDVCHEEWVSVRARLGLKGEGPNNNVGFDPRDRGLTWAPPGLPPSKVEEYYSMLPEISVPRIGTPGERHRDRQLATQLPKQDLARAYCRHLDSQHSASADDFMAARNEIALDIGSVKEILERGHECGVCHEPLKYGSLVVSASKLGLSYHPSCFQCTQCRELLVDLAYCVHDDSLYCERHYAEQLKPRCAACDELIFSGEYTKAMNKDWHSGHFCCWQCDESLTGQRYVLRDEHPYCIKCYESVFANGCEECSKIIGIDSKDLSYKDKHWHEACFLCNKCRVSLVDKQFGSKVDKIYCGNCYDAQFASRCDGCGEIFRAGTKKMEYKTRQWHEKCFCCVVCKAPIGTKSFIPREQEIYCAGCYEDKFATRCVKCNKIITSGGVTYKNEPWHRDCFTCSNCNNSLAGQRFTSRDDKPYCAECFGELFAKRCTACTKPITGIGGTRFISFEDRHWHNNCFICAGCNTSLVGRGFITDGDDIICPECAKQKLSE